jgi:hypothetical protein
MVKLGLVTAFAGLLALPVSFLFPSPPPANPQWATATTFPIADYMIVPTSTTTTPATTTTTIPADILYPKWYSIARGIGWPESELGVLDVVIHRESRGNALAFNSDDPNGGSWGLVQVNGSWSRWLRDRGLIARLEDLFDPETNLRAGLAIYNYGMNRYGYGWGPWGRTAP